MSETKSKGGRPSEYTGKSFAVIATKETIKGYKSKSPAIEAVMKTILATKNSPKVAAAFKTGNSVIGALTVDGKKAPKVDSLLGVEVEFLDKEGLSDFVKIGTAHIRRAIAENLIVVA